MITDVDLILVNVRYYSKFLCYIPSSILEMEKEGFRVLFVQACG